MNISEQRAEGNQSEIISDGDMSGAGDEEKIELDLRSSIKLNSNEHSLANIN